MHHGMGFRNLRRGLLAAAAVLVSAGAGFSGSGIPDEHRAKLASPVQTLLSTAKPQRLIIQLQEPVPAGTLAQLKKAGARITRRYGFLPMVAANVPGNAIAAVAALPGVTRVSLDAPLSAAAR